MLVGEPEPATNKGARTAVGYGSVPMLDISRQVTLPFCGIETWRVPLSG